MCPVLRSWLDHEEWARYEEREQARQAMSTLQQSGAGALSSELVCIFKELVYSTVD